MTRSKPTRRLRVLVGGVAALVAVVLGVLAALSVDGVSTRITREVLDRIAPAGTLLQVGRVPRLGPGGLVATEVEFHDEVRGIHLRVDTLRADYQPLSWRWKRLALSRVEVVGLALRVDAPGTASPEPTPSPPENAGTPWGVRLDAVELRPGPGSGRAAAALPGPAAAPADSSFRVGEVTGSFQGLRVSPELGAESWSLALAFAPSGLPEGWGALSARGRWANPVLQLDTLSLRSPRSRVSGRLRLPLDSTWSRPGGLEWGLEATPLALADLEGLVPVPGVLAGDSLILASWSEAAGDSARVHLEATTTVGAEARADVRWGRAGSRIGYRGDVEVADLELRRYLGEGVPVGSTSGTVVLQGLGEWREGALAALASSLDLRVSAPEGEANLEGRVVRSPGADGLPVDSVELSLERLRWGDDVEGRGTLQAVHTGGTVDWRTDLRPRPGGRVAGSGRLTDLGTSAALGWSADLRLDGVVEPRSGSVVSGRVQGDGSGTSLPANLGLTLAPSEIAGWSVDTATVRWTGEPGNPSSGGRLEGWTEGAFGGLDLEADLGIREDGGRLALRVVELDSVGLPDPGEATEETSGTSGSGVQDGAEPPSEWAAVRLSGHLDGALEWEGPVAEALDPARWSGDMEAVLRSAAGPVALSPVDSVSATLRLASGIVEAVLRSDLAGGGRLGVQAVGTLAPPLEVRITDGRFQGLDVSSFVPSSPETRLAGALTGEIRGAPDGGRPTIQGQIELDPSTVREGRIEGLAGEFVVGPGLVRGDLFAELAGGSVRGRIDGSEGWEAEGWSRTPWRVEAEMALPELGAFLELPDTAVSLNGRIEAELDPESGSRVDLGLWQARGWGARIDTAVVRGRLTGAVLTVDTVLVRSNLAAVAGGGSLPRTVLGLPASVPPVGSPAPPPGPSALTLAVTVPDSAAVLRLGETRVEVAGGGADFQAECPGEECTLTGQIDLETVLLGRWSVLSLRAGVDGSVGPGRRYGPTRTGILVEGLRTPGLDARNATFQTHWNGTDLEVVGTALVDDRRAAVAELRIDPGQRSLAFQRLDLRFDDDRWSLERPVTFRSDSTGLSLDSLVMASPPQRVLARLGEEEGSRYLSLEADSLRLGAFTDLLGRPGVGGSASGQLRLRGEEQTLVLVGELAADLTLAGRPSHRIQATAEARDGDFTAEATVADPDGGARIRGRAEGRVPGVGDGRWTGTVELDEVPLGWAGVYAPPAWLRNATGSIQGRLALTGGPQGLSVSGPLGLEDGRAEVPRAAITLDDIQVSASLEGRTLVLESARARSRGQLTLEGSLTVPEGGAVPEIDLQLTADDFLASNTREVEAAFRGAVGVQGTLDVPRVEGRVELLQATYRIPATLGRRVRAVTLTEEDWATLQSRFGIAPPDDDDGSVWLPRSALLDLQVTLGRDIWLRRDANPELALQFTGDLRITKGSQDEELQLQGSVESIPGRSYVEEFGRRFNLEDGSVAFRGPLDDSRLDVTAVYEVPTSPDEDPVTIRLNVTGWLDGLELALSSEPSLSNGDVVSYLATGRPASSAFSGDGSGNFGAEFLASQLSGTLEQFAQEEVGLDVLQIQQEGLHGTSLVAGKYVNPRLFLGFRQGVTFQADEGRSFTEGLTSQAEVEYAALNWLVVNIQGGTSAIRFFLEGTYGW